MDLLLTVGSAIETGTKLITTLNKLADEISNAGRNFNQLRHEVDELNGVLIRMQRNFSGSERSFAAQTGTIGSHWNAVGRMIEGCSNVLSEMDTLLCTAPNRSGNLWDKPLLAAWLRLRDSDVAFYRADIQNRKNLLQLELTMIIVSRDLNGEGGRTGFHTDLAAAETKITELIKEVKKLRATANRGLVMLPMSSNRGPEAARHTAEALSEESAHSAAQLLTANQMEACLSSASELLSSASTVAGQRTETSVYEGQPKQSEEMQASIRKYIQGQVPQEGEPFSRSLLLLIPRILGAAVLLAVYVLFIMFMLIYLAFWVVELILTLFRRVEIQVERLKRHLSTGFGAMSNLASVLLLWHRKTSSSNDDFSLS